MLSGVLRYLHMHWIPHACGYIAYVLVWQEEGALCVEHLVLFHILSSLRLGGSWLGCQVLPAIGTVSFLELAANSESSRMFQAPNLYIVMQLLPA